MLHMFFEFIYILYWFIRVKMVLFFYILHITLLNYVPVQVQRRILFFFCLTTLLYLLWVSLILLFILLSVINIIYLSINAEFKLSLMVLSEVMLLLCIFYFLGAVTTFTYVNIVIIPNLLLHIIDSNTPIFESIFYFLYKIVKSYDEKCNKLMDYFLCKGDTVFDVGVSKTLHYVVWYVLYLLLICFFFYFITYHVIDFIFYLVINAYLILEWTKYIYNSPNYIISTLSHLFVTLISNIRFYIPGKVTVFIFFLLILSFFL